MCYRATLHTTLTGSVSIRTQPVNGFVAVAEGGRKRSRVGAVSLVCLVAAASIGATLRPRPSPGGQGRAETTRHDTTRHNMANNPRCQSVWVPPVARILNQCSEGSRCSPWAGGPSGFPRSLHTQRGKGRLFQTGAGLGRTLRGAGGVGHMRISGASHGCGRLRVLHDVVHNLVFEELDSRSARH